MLTRDTSKMGAPDGADLHVAALRWWAHACRLSQQGMLHGTPLENIQRVPGEFSWRSLHWSRTVCVGMEGGCSPTFTWASQCIGLCGRLPPQCIADPNPS